MGESIAKASSRELNEETGHTVKGVKLLTNQLFATSPGITTEMKGMALALATGGANGNNRSASERKSIIDTFLVPVGTLTHYNRFMAWLEEMNQKYTVGMDVLAAQALLPPPRRAAHSMRWPRCYRFSTSVSALAFSPCFRYVIGHKDLGYACEHNHHVCPTCEEFCDEHHL